MTELPVCDCVAILRLLLRWRLDGRTALRTGPGSIGASPLNGCVEMRVPLLRRRAGLIALLVLLSWAASGGPLWAQQAGNGQVAFGGLPQDLSPWGMFMTADRLVKAVMIGLAVASVITWTVLV